MIYPSPPLASLPQGLGQRLVELRPYRATTFVAFFGVAFPLKGGLTARLTPPHAAVPKKRTVLSMDDVACKRKADHHQGCDRFNKGSKKRNVRIALGCRQKTAPLQRKNGLTSEKNDKHTYQTIEEGWVYVPLLWIKGREAESSALCIVCTCVLP